MVPTNFKMISQPLTSKPLSTPLYKGRVCE
jgi:hypothetical protein